MFSAVLVALVLATQVPEAPTETSPLDTLSQAMASGETQGPAFEAARDAVVAGAAAGETDSMNMMGVMVQRGLVQSDLSSEDWYRRAIANNDGAASEAAQVNLALQLYSTQGRAADARAILESMESPADHLRGLVQGYLGYDYLVGAGGEPNYELGRAYLNGAIALGFENAYVFEQYAQFWLNPPEAAGVEPRVDRAEQLYRRGVSINSLESGWRLGMLTLQTGGDPATAYRYVEWASDNGHLQASISRAVMLAIGQGVEANAEASREWYLRAVQQGSAHAARAYGMMLIIGEGGQTNPALGYGLLELARDKGDEGATQLLDAMPEGAAARPSNREVTEP